MNINSNNDVHDTLAKRAFLIIELVEVAGISDVSKTIIRKKLLDLGNDIIRLKPKEGDSNGT